MQPFTRISAEESQQLIRQGAVVLDIRDAESFRQGHIPGALHLDNHSAAGIIQQADPDTPTLVVCYHGHASQSAAAFLNSQDFSQVYSMDGGFSQWSLLFPEQVERS